MSLHKNQKIKHNLFCFLKRGGEKGEKRQNELYRKSSHVRHSKRHILENGWRTSPPKVYSKTLKRVHAENNRDVFLNTFFTGIASVVAAVKVTTMPCVRV